MSSTRVLSSAEVLQHELFGERLPLQCQTDRLRLRDRIKNPSFLVQDVHQVEVQRFPNRAVMKGEIENSECRLGQFVGVEFLWKLD